MVLGLERVVKRDDEGMVACREDLLLGERSFDFIPFYHFLLTQH